MHVLPPILSGSGHDSQDGRKTEAVSGSVSYILGRGVNYLEAQGVCAWRENRGDSLGQFSDGDRFENWNSAESPSLIAFSLSQLM